MTLNSLIFRITRPDMCFVQTSFFGTAALEWLLWARLDLIYRLRPWQSLCYLFTGCHACVITHNNLQHKGLLSVIDSMCFTQTVMQSRSQDLSEKITAFQYSSIKLVKQDACMYEIEGYNFCKIKVSCGKRLSFLAFWCISITVSTPSPAVQMIC